MHFIPFMNLEIEAALKSYTFMLLTMYVLPVLNTQCMTISLKKEVSKQQWAQCDWHGVK